MSIADTDLVEVLRDGVSYKATGSQVKDYIQINSSIEAAYLVVAGGGGGAGLYGGGGGAGGFLTGTVALQGGVVYSAIVGAGGIPNPFGDDSDQGGNSSLSGSGITTVTALGGGIGGALDDNGGNGASGGGGGCAVDRQPVGGSGTAGQGHKGGGGSYAEPRRFLGGGGGGAGSAGVSGIAGGQGGSGKASSITGSSITYAVGGRGNDRNLDDATPGTNGRGNGGGGFDREAPTHGGSGVVILRVKTSQYTGITTGSPEITQDGADTVIRFTDNGTYTS